MSDDRRANTPDEMIEVVKAIADGKTVEFRSIYGQTSTWEESRLRYVMLPAFNVNQYRVKQEPRIFYVNEYINKHSGNAVFSAPSRNRQLSNRGSQYLEFIQTVELVEKLPG